MAHTGKCAGIALTISLFLSGCADTEPSVPACPQTLVDKPVKSAGCLSIDRGKLLVIEEMSGKISTPGGSANPGEPAHCTAHRETWEETGLNVKPTRLIRVFDNGFHLFECQADSAQTPPKAPFYLEVKKVMWITIDDFDQFQWRFPEQKDWLKQQMLKSVPARD